VSANIIDQLTDPQPSVRTRLVFQLARVLFARTIYTRGDNPAPFHHAIAVAWHWNYFDARSITSYSQRTYTLLVNDVTQIIQLLRSGAISPELLNDWPLTAELDLIEEMYNDVQA
jgi:hypothetical protein